MISAVAELPKPSRRAYMMVALAAMASAGCGNLPAVTSGHIGCGESEIKITDEIQGWSTSTWTAECRGKKFFCSTTTKRVTSSEATETRQTACREALTTDAQSPTGAASSSAASETVVSGPPASAADSGGCRYDTQCKGERVCEKGSCVTPVAVVPPTTAPEAVPAATPTTPAP